MRRFYANCPNCGHHRMHLLGKSREEFEPPS